MKFKSEYLRGIRFNSIFVKLALAASFAIFVVAGVSDRLSWNNAKLTSVNELHQRALDINGLLALQLGGSIKFGNQAVVKETLEAVLTSAQGDTAGAAAFNAVGVPLYLTESSEEIREEIKTIAASAVAEQRNVMSEDGLIIATPAFFGADRAVVGAVVTHWTVKNHLMVLYGERSKMFLMSGVTFLIVFIAFVTFLWNHVSRPLVLLERAVQSVENGEYDVVIPALGRNDEIGGIALRLNHFKGALALAKQAEESQGRVVDELGRALKGLAGGNLKIKIESDFPIEYDQLKVDFNAATIALDETISVVSSNVVFIRGETSNITRVADELAKRTERQAATLEETAAALDQLTTSTRNATAGADQASKMSEQARSNAEVGGIVAREAVMAMGEIKSSSGEISKITSVIDDIAFQTNLLAFNAGVEAARAGEAGRGFAVVATEVRALAQRSSEAASEINALILTSGEHVKQGVELVGKTGDSLDSIVLSVADISKRVVAIASSAREQATGLSEINEAVMELDHVTQQNAAMFDKTSAANHALMQETEALAAAVNIFNLSTDVESLATKVTRETDPSPQSIPVKKVVGLSERANLSVATATDLGEWDEF